MTAEIIDERPRIAQVVAAGVRGLARGPFWQLRDIGLEVRQALEDYRALRVRAQQGEWAERHRPSYIGLHAWYALPFPLYQVADDTLTYPLYLVVVTPLGVLRAYVVVVLATLALAAPLGVIHRVVERQRADMIGAPVVPDDADHVVMLLDAAVNSAPWQVARRANAQRSAGGPVKLVSVGRIIQYALAYALCNTLLYLLAERLPVNEWLGFGLMLLGAWSVGGAYVSVRDETKLRNADR